VIVVVHSTYGGGDIREKDTTNNPTVCLFI